MKPLFFAAASGLALGLAACTPSHPPTARTALDCPQAQGDLTRTGVAPDQRSCTYRTADGSDVTLQLVATNGDPKGALAALESTLVAPTQELVKGEKDAQAKVEVAKGEVMKAEASAQAASDAADKAAKEAEADASKAAAAAGEDVNVHVPGLHVQAHDGSGKGDKAHIDLPGIHIDADDDSDQARVKVGGITIDAHDDGATIRVYREVRLRGEAFSREKRGLRATYLFTGKGLADGVKFVGYEAAGPKAGPLTVAVVRSSVDHDEVDIHNHALRDIKRLVRRNSGT